MKCQICNSDDRGVFQFTKKGKEIAICKGCMEKYEDDLVTDFSILSSRKFTQCPICKKPLRTAIVSISAARKADSDPEWAKKTFCQCETQLCEECGKKLPKKEWICKDCKSKLKARFKEIKSMLP